MLWANGKQRMQLGARISEQTPMCGDVRQAVGTRAHGCGRLSAGWQMIGTECARLAKILGKQIGQCEWAAHRCGRARWRAQTFGRQTDVGKAKAWWLAVWAKAWSMCGTCDEPVKSW
ncbi:UNVERIFIED_CONTAM: hypothetical protein Slati_2675100 [Sesamum latifolium]|uniref:Uncharacterized protein n=1 Tax=Sesamum latifolium TaxID=2727402 RepID=A0AAW2VVU2_9LAMI